MLNLCYLLFQKIFARQGIERATFQRVGYEKEGQEEKNTYERWSEKYQVLADQLEAMKVSKDLDASQKALVQAALDSAGDYRKYFQDLADSRQQMDDAFAQWGD